MIAHQAQERANLISREIENRENEVLFEVTVQLPKKGMNIRSGDLAIRLAKVIAADKTVVKKAHQPYISSFVPPLEK